MAKKRNNKAGRPPLVYGKCGALINLRMPEHMRADLEMYAGQARRRLSEEIRIRLEESLTRGAVVLTVTRKIETSK